MTAGASVTQRNNESDDAYSSFGTGWTNKGTNTALELRVGYNF